MPSSYHACKGCPEVRYANDQHGRGTNVLVQWVGLGSLLLVQREGGVTHVGVFDASCIELFESLEGIFPSACGGDDLL